MYHVVKKERSGNHQGKLGVFYSDPWVWIFPDNCVYFGIKKFQTEHSILNVETMENRWS